MQCTQSSPVIDSDLAGKLLTAIIPALECAGFTIADGSVSELGLVLTGPEVGGYLEIGFNPLPAGDPDPDAHWAHVPLESELPAWMVETGEHPTLSLPPIAGGCEDGEPPIPAEPAFTPSEEDWREYEAWSRTLEYLDRFNAVRDDASERPA